MLYVATVMPYNIAFNDSESGSKWYFIDLTIDFSFIFDVLVNCVSGFIDEEGHLITNNKKIFINYLRGWFFIDICASFPFNLVESDIEK